MNATEIQLDGVYYEIFWEFRTESFDHEFGTRKERFMLIDQAKMHLNHKWYILPQDILLDMHDDFLIEIEKKRGLYE